MKKLTGILLLLVLGFACFRLPLMAQDDETEATPVPSEEINENIKERLKKVAGEQAEIVSEKRKTAIAGDLQNIANETLTLKTDGEIKLASVSGETTYVNVDNNDELELTDLIIGDYAVALGFLNGSDVLDTRRVLLYTERPEPIAKKSFFGNIDNVDEEEETISLLSPSGEQLIVYLSKNSIIENKTGEEAEEVDLADLAVKQTVALVFRVDKDGDNELLSLLAIPPAIETVGGFEASPSGQLDEASPSQDNDLVPAELGQ